MRYFNTSGVCIPEEHYMVDLTSRLTQIKVMVDKGDYFTINRGRQYGKTTTLRELQKRLKAEYVCIRISFEGIGQRGFETEEAFCRTFMRLIRNALKISSVADDAAYIASWVDETVSDFVALSDHISNQCEDRKLVLMIDEVDRSSNYGVFVVFLGMLRDKYLNRKDAPYYTFHSVILAGLHDIKNLKAKMIEQGKYTPHAGESTTYNSPWNIAADYEVDMSFNPDDIGSMLTEYKEEHPAIAMDTAAIAQEIYAYAGGYPFLVSRLCQLVDEKLHQDWSLNGVQKAAQMVLSEQNTLFDDMIKNLEAYPDLYQFIYELLIVGEKKLNSIDDPVVNRALMFCFLKRLDDNQVIIHNRIFEIRISKYLITKESREKKERRVTGILKQDVVKDGRFDMELCLKKFARHYRELFNESDIAFLERQGKMLFLSYISPLLNGDGFYHFESQLSDLRRMDIVVDYNHEQFIIELKLWHGEAGHRAAYEQLAGYLRTKGAERGYLLTFDLRKSGNREPCEEWVNHDGMRIFDVVL
ncbi:MAG: ATP-binding protein [Treponema sp.]|jgi:hypothetical protein|nr:ATP-binding protein [Treponema sp.]